MRGLKDKVALVVGGAGGNGSAACYRMGEEGCKVVVADFAADKAEAVAEKNCNKDSCRRWTGSLLFRRPGR